MSVENQSGYSESVVEAMTAASAPYPTETPGQPGAVNGMAEI